MTEAELRAELTKAHDVIARLRAQAQRWVGMGGDGKVSMDLRAGGSGEANAGRVVLAILAGVELRGLLD